MLVRLPAGTVGASGPSALRLAFMGRQGLRWVLDVDISNTTTPSNIITCVPCSTGESRMASFAG